jgi:outer membrane lipoprotein-sorting protein
MRTILRCVILILSGLALAVAENVSAAPSAEEIMTNSFLASKVADSTTDVTFRLRTPAGQERIRLTSGPSKLIPGTTDNRRLITFDAPSDIKGTKTLLIEHSNADDDIWIYLPAMKKVRRLVASNKRDSFVGTDFSYGDVIGHKVTAWLHKFIKEDNVGGKECYVIESVPKNHEVQEISGYSKRISWVEKKSWVAVRVDIYDTNGELLKKMTYEDIQEVDSATHKWQAMKQTAANVQTGHSTILEFKNFKANVGVSENVFTTRSLEN